MRLSSQHQVVRCYKGMDLCHYCGSADWHDIRFSDCRIEQVGGRRANPVTGGSTPIRLIVDRQTQLGYPRGVGSIYNVDFDRVTFDDSGPNPAAIRGYDATNSVRNIAFRDLHMNGRLVKGADPSLLVLEHTRGISAQGETLPQRGTAETTSPNEKR